MSSAPVQTLAVIVLVAALNAIAFGRPCVVKLRPSTAVAGPAAGSQSKQADKNVLRVNPWDTFPAVEPAGPPAPTAYNNKPPGSHNLADLVAMVNGGQFGSATAAGSGGGSVDSNGNAVGQGTGVASGGPGGFGIGLGVGLAVNTPVGSWTVGQGNSVAVGK